MKESYQRMLKFYLLIFFFLIVVNIPNLLFWQGYIVQKIAIGLIGCVVLLYLFVFSALRRKIKSFENS